MTEAEKQLLERILESPYFAHTPSLKRVLRYLCERTGGPDSPSLKEYEIAADAMDRPPSFDPKTDPIVRVNVATIRQRLHSYFESQGRNESLRLEVPKGPYRAIFIAGLGRPSSAHTRESGLIWLRALWSPYLSGHANMLVYTDLLFFRDDAGNYIRNIYVNDLAAGLDELQKRFPLGSARTLRPSFHFLSAGEVNVMLSLVQMFAQLNTPLTVRNSRFTSWSELRSSNLVILGSSRTNSFLDSLQGGSPFLITDHEIRNQRPRGSEQESYVGQRYMEGKLEKVIEHALVTRRPGLTTGTAVTMISANHGRAMEGAGTFLASEGQLEEVFHNAGLTSPAKLPENFQLLLRVHMVDFDEEVINVECVAHRIISQE